MRTAWVAIVLAAACGEGSSKSSTMAKSEGPTCAAVADSMVAIIGAGKEPTKAFVETKKAFATIIRTRCDEDAWATDAKQCLFAMKSNDDAIRCSSLLTEEQQANLERDRTAKFGKGNAPPPEPEPEPEPAAAPPPAPIEAEKKAEPKADKAKRAMPKGMKPKKPGDPCDGGE